MAETLGNNALNRAGNTVALPMRTIGSTGMALIDVLNTFDNITRQSYEVVMNTRTRIKEMWMHALNKGPVIQKTANTILATVLTPVIPLEGTIRSVVNPLWNGAKNLRGITSNFFRNIGNSIRNIFSKKNLQQFKFHHTEPIIEKNKVSKSNRVSKLLFGKKDYK